MCLFRSNCLKIGINHPHQRVQVAEFNSQGMAIKVSFHMLLHILGKYHEHQRPDRDQYIKIEWNNVQEGNQS